MREAVSQRSITLMSDESFLSTISDIDMTEQEKADLVAINSKARVDASKTAFIVLRLSCRRTADHAVHHGAS